MKNLLTVAPPFSFTGFGGRKLGVTSRPLSLGRAPAPAGALNLCGNAYGRRFFDNVLNAENRVRARKPQLMSSGRSLNSHLVGMPELGSERRQELYGLTVSFKISSAVGDYPTVSLDVMHAKLRMVGKLLIQVGLREVDPARNYSQRSRNIRRDNAYAHRGISLTNSETNNFRVHVVKTSQVSKVS